MKNKYSLLIVLCLLNSLVKSQTPQTPMINWAFQTFASTTESDSRYRLVVSQSISPRVFKPCYPENAERVSIMYIGNWLDITNEVVITGPGVTSPRGVTAGSTTGGNQQHTAGEIPNAIYPNYSGAYCIVSFIIASDAAVGTHTVKLRRPRLGAGKDETVFYIEVYDAVRIRSIRFSRNALSSAQMGSRGKITIKGDYLDRINSIGSANGMLSDISNISKSPTSISFTATLSKKGYLGYNALMNSVLPAYLKNTEYPTQFVSTDRPLGKSGLNIQ